MWDIFQEIRLNEQSAKQADTDSSLRRASLNLEELARQVRKMALVNQALYELLKEKTGISDEDLRRRIKEIDLRDGVADAKINSNPLRCPKCQNTMTAGALSCPNCGVTVAPKYPFEA